MFDPAMEVMCTVCADVAREAATGTVSPDAWARAREALGDARDAEPELAAALDAEDGARLAEIVDDWHAGHRLLPERDRAVLKRAMKAYRKRLKVTRLDDESKIGGNPMTKGSESAVVGIRPPERYPRAVWDELARQGRLIENGGTYELPPGG